MAELAGDETAGRKAPAPPDRVKCGCNPTWQSCDAMGIKRSPAGFAEHFGRVGRAVFAGETWKECWTCLRESWDLLETGIAWNDALDDIHRGWAEGPVEQHTAFENKPSDRGSSPNAR
jgi:hypothetical protein